MIKVEAASGDETGAAFFSSVFFIKIGLISVGAEQDVRHPVWESAHLLTDDIQANVGITFDNKFIVDVSDDKAVLEGFHGIAEDVAADGLDDIFHKFECVNKSL